jgi:hypothetical protein
VADPIRLLYNWPTLRGRTVYQAAQSGQIVRQDSLRQAIYLIQKHELAVWFEPDWQNARFLSRRFRHCAICSIPIESNTLNLKRIPGWRPRPDNGQV